MTIDPDFIALWIAGPTVGLCRSRNISEHTPNQVWAATLSGMVEKVCAILIVTSLIVLAVSVDRLVQRDVRQHLAAALVAAPKR